MIRQTRSELLKIRSTRTTVGLVLAMLLLVLLLVVLTGLLSDGLDSASSQRSLLGLGGLASIFAGLAGLLLVTSEYRFGTIRPTLLFTPRRSRVVAGKAAAGLLTGLVFGALGEGVGFAVGYAILSARGFSLALDRSDVFALLFGTLVACGLWSALGVGLGAIVRSQVGGVIGLLAWLFVVENLLSALVPSVGRFAPGQAQVALTGDTGDDLLPAVAGGAMLVAWAAMLVLGGLLLTARRDAS